MTWFVKARTASSLGLLKILRVVLYRLGLRLEIHPVCKISGTTPDGPFFLEAKSTVSSAVGPVVSWQTVGTLFSYWPVSVAASPPDWFSNPLTGQRILDVDRSWWKIPDFDSAVGDIKLIWELSRFDWLLAFAQRAALGDTFSLQRLNVWLQDWCNCNPPYQGPNWKCGQEASIRVIHLSVAALLLRQTRQSTPALRALIRLHLQRIAPTVKYAMAQDNNHGTSEAAALFIGGSWLHAAGDTAGAAWMHAGRQLLEHSTQRLIGLDGTFSQYSLNYHRVVLDTLSIAEIWRREFELPAFSQCWQGRALSAAQWLRHMVNPMTGDGPNVGANDGARLLPLTDTAYRDYRPSVQLAMALFANQKAYLQSGFCSQNLEWLGVTLPETVAAEPSHYVADDGGFAMLRSGKVMAMMRYPRFRFRPSQADVLHLDLWLGGENLLRDGGTFSYNTEPRWVSYFGGTESHNTVQFDGRDQMPRISRFLLGDWLKTQRIETLSVSGSTVRFGAGYRDRKGAHHFRRINLGDSHLRIEDRVGGFKQDAVLRWRLAQGDWFLEHTPTSVSLTRSGQVPVTMILESSAAIARCELVEGWESRNYLEKMSIQVLEIEIHQAGALTTEINWSV